jgi:TPR repeat protein
MLALLAAGCGGGAAEAMRPEAPSAADATGRSTIPAVDGPSSPLVVDWKPEQRADLEEAIHDGVAIIAWDKQGLRLLKRCKVSGDYGYLPVVVKKDVVRLETADDVQASLPLGGLGIAGKIGGGFSSGTTLDIALAMVGKRRTTWNDVTRDELTGTCDGATHYVRAILVGAFAMKTGSRAKAAAAVEIFGAGTSGESSSSKDVSSTDGKLSACEAATGEEGKPPPQCAAILRLELEPIAKAGTKPTAKPPPSQKDQPEVKTDAVEGCQPGFVFSGGGCKKQRAELPHACKPTDGAECEEQCEKGDPLSCDRLGTLIASGKHGSDPAKASAAFEKACNAGNASGCANLGVRMLYGPNKDVAKGLSYLEKACLSGSARACEIAGEAALYGVSGPKDPVKALKMFVKGCEGGSYGACTNAGFLYTGGGGAAIQRDDARALGYSKRACYGGNAVACGNAGYKVELGQSVKADPKLAMSMYERACRLDAGACFRAGMFLLTGAPGIPKDLNKAKELLSRSCNAGSGIEAMACVVGASLFGETTKPNAGGLAHTASIMKPQCDQNEGRACTFFGIATYGQGKKADAQKIFKTACGYKDPLGCELGKKLK